MGCRTYYGDSGKKSKGGRLRDDRMVNYYYNGKLLIDEDLDTIRNRLTLE